MFLKFLLLLLISLELIAADTLKSTYYVNSSDINISAVVSDIEKDTKLFSIDENRYTKRIKSTDFIQLLEIHGYKSFSADSRYVKFIKKSPIDTSIILQEIEKYYKEKYKYIDIKNITILPRGYIESLPENYVVHIPKREYLSNSGTIYIKTPQNKKIFFDYNIFADVVVYLTRGKLKKDVELSPINSTKKSIMLEKFRAMPVQDIEHNKFETKRHLKEDSILTIRDVQALRLVKRNSNLNVSLHNKNIAIEFIAKALQDGRLGDIITAQKSDGQRVKVMITGKNRAEMK